MYNHLLLIPAPYLSGRKNEKSTILSAYFSKPELKLVHHIKFGNGEKS